MANLSINHGHKDRSFMDLDRLVTYCYNRFDLNCGLLDLHREGTKEARLIRRRAERWSKRASRYAMLRNTMGARG